MGEAAFINREIWIAGDERSDQRSSQVNHDPEALLGCLSCFTLSATGKEERKQEKNLKLLLLSKKLMLEHLYLRFIGPGSFRYLKWPQLPQGVSVFYIFDRDSNKCALCSCGSSLSLTSLFPFSMKKCFNFNFRTSSASGRVYGLHLASEKSQCYLSYAS